MTEPVSKPAYLDLANCRFQAIPTIHAMAKSVDQEALPGKSVSLLGTLPKNASKLGSSSYRPDIDGLRAIAILSVVIFHAFPSKLPGGFAGVDIFFVISGFLISSIILRGMQHGNFSFPQFYAHRIKRIFPALTLVLAGSYLFGWFTLLPDEFKQLSKHIAAGLGFVQNFVLWKEAGYFNTASELKPLMHLWSLAIEEQFYLIYPLAIWCVWRARLNVFAFIVVMGLLSFGLNVGGIEIDPTETFFLPQTRFWEILAGSVLAYLQLSGKQQLKKHVKNWPPRALFSGARHLQPGQAVLMNSLAVAALLLLAFTAFGLDSTKRFPGWWAVAPVVAAFVLIGVGPSTWVNRAILANRGMVFLGLISYPLYLWHWPILSFLQILESGSPSREIRITAVALSFLLAWLTYRFLETPIRKGKNGWVKVGSLCVTAAVVGYAGYYTVISDGFASRRVVQLNAAISPARLSDYQGTLVSRCGLDVNTAKRFAQCQSDARGAAKFALLGDSKAAALAPGIFRETTSNGYWLFIGGANAQGTAPVPVISDADQYSQYQDLAKIALDGVIANREIQVVVLTVATRALFQLDNDYSIDDLSQSKNFNLALNGLDRALSQLINAGKKVIITVDNPTLKDPKQCISRVSGLDFVNDLLRLGPNHSPCRISYDKHLELSGRYRELLEKLQVKYAKHLRVFDPLGLLCDMKDRICGSFLDGVLLYSYSDHVSERGSILIARKLVPFVESFAEERNK